ncbi:hypothetical protein FS749_004475, partial [Ceratobasidium sp. UAMH 11750]
MLELCRRPPKHLNPFDDSFTALEHIQFIDLFAVENENSLRELASQLLAAAVNPHRLSRSTPGSQSSTKEVSKALELHNQRPAKRSVKLQEKASDNPSDSNIISRNAMDPSTEQQPSATQTTQPPAVGVNQGQTGPALSFATLAPGQPADQQAWSYGFGYEPSLPTNQGYSMPYDPYQTTSALPMFSSQSNPYGPFPNLSASQHDPGLDPMLEAAYAVSLSEFSEAPYAEALHSEAPQPSNPVDPAATKADELRLDIVGHDSTQFPPPFYGLPVVETIP